MRNKNNDKNFKKWLLNVGDGIFSNNYENDNEVIKISEEMLSNGDLITEIFGKDINPNDPNYHKCIILAPTNANVLDLNNENTSRIKGESREYLSIDTAEDIDNENLYSV